MRQTKVYISLELVSEFVTNVIPRFIVPLAFLEALRGGRLRVLSVVSQCH